MNSETLRVLILEDEQSVRGSVITFFKDCGWQVSEAVSAEDGFQKLKVEKPHGAVVDICLPDVDGEAFIRKAAGKFPDLALIILTGSLDYSIPEDIAALPQVCEEVFRKPLYDLGILLEALQSRIGG